ncbi:uncharacterized protein J4E87_009379 [Alternaria ethzedia]|uniref:uncharacterized protein n=1 Tax=Alternaria ethzedia TaxID=181014 RepID=UPI0020C5B252|nr:uncharacterized protein J4E87_009379 [Alternaria ethzedia]KAI4614784.1 hypothetical protein J4E87_009379 [Alternaria ethzedia]
MSAIPTTTLTRVGANSYYIPSRLTSIPPDSRECIFGSAPDLNDGLVPITLFVLKNAMDASPRNLRSTVKSWLKTDDVFNKHFLQHVYFLCLANTKYDLDSLAISIPEEWQNRSVHTVVVSSDVHLVSFRSGPYFASNVGIRQAWRLFDDTHEAFQVPVVPDGHRENTIAIKDNIDLKGVRTSAGSRAYQTLYPEKKCNATCVEKLLEAGAAIVGKTKTVQFASGENARDWIDYSAPFNPRGDGYQEPSGSSTGSATVVSAELDTVGFFTRSIQMATTISQTLCARQVTKKPRAAAIELLYPTDIFSGCHNKYLSHTGRFIRHLEDFLQVKRKKLDVDGIFRRQSMAGGTSLKNYLDTQTVAHIQLYDCYQNCQTFVRDYEKEFRKKAFVDPYIEYKWCVIMLEMR